MNYLSDKKSWIMATIESLGILGFNALFIPSFYHALGEQVSTVNVVIVSAGLFFIRLLWLYANMVFRLLLERKK